MEEIDIKELIDMFYQRKILISLVVILFIILGAIYTTNFIVPIYKSTTSLVLVQAGADSYSMAASGTTNSITTTDITLNSKLVENYRTIAESDSVAEKVISNLNLNVTTEEFKKKISVTSIADTEVIEITARDEDPKKARDIAEEVAFVFIERIKEIYNLENVHVLDNAVVATNPSNVHLVKNMAIFAMVGLVLICGYILLVNMLDTTIKTDSDIESNINLPVLGQIVMTSEETAKKIKIESDIIIDNNIEENDKEEIKYE